MDIQKDKELKGYCGNVLTKVKINNVVTFFCPHILDHECRHGGEAHNCSGQYIVERGDK